MNPKVQIDPQQHRLAAVWGQFCLHLCSEEVDQSRGYTVLISFLVQTSTLEPIIA